MNSVSMPRRPVARARSASSATVGSMAMATEPTARPRRRPAPRRRARRCAPASPAGARRCGSGGAWSPRPAAGGRRLLVGPVAVGVEEVARRVLDLAVALPAHADEVEPVQQPDREAGRDEQDGALQAGLVALDGDEHDAGRADAHGQPRADRPQRGHPAQPVEREAGGELVQRGPLAGLGQPDRRGQLGAHVLRGLAERRAVGQRHGSVALGQALAVGPEHERHVGVGGRLEAQRRGQPALARGRPEQVGAADDLVDALLGVVDDHRQVVGHGAVVAPDHEVVDDALDVPRDPVREAHDRPVGGDAQRRAVARRPPARPARPP